MTNTTIDVRCPYCGQRMGLHDTERAEFTCVNCKTTQPVADAIVKPERFTLTEKEFVDIWLHPFDYPQSKVASVFAALIMMPMEQWPKSIREQYMQYRKRRRNRRILILIVFIILLLLFDIYIFIGGVR